MIANPLVRNRITLAQALDAADRQVVEQVRARVIDSLLSFIEQAQLRKAFLAAETLAEALAVVRATVGQHGPAAVSTWMLIEDDIANADGGRTIAAGESHVCLALDDGNGRTQLVRKDRQEFIFRVIRRFGVRAGCVFTR